MARMLYLALFAASALAAPAIIQADADLTLLGPLYQPAANDSLDAWATAKKAATDAIKQLIATGNNSYGPIDTQGTSFSASVFSLTSDEPLFEFHFEAPTLKGSYTKGKLSENTIYRAGSISKLFTIYQFLVDIGDHVYTDPITKYVPELADAAEKFENPLMQTNWSEVTVGALASQLSGIGRDYLLGDLAIETFQSPPVSDDIPDGYPPLDPLSLPKCNSYGPQPQCSRKQFLEGIINHPPAFRPYQTPVYSNLAYAILGLAYEKITGTDFNQGFQELFRGKLGMNSSYAQSPGLKVDAVVPRNDSYALFTYDIGLQGPAGNYYFSTKDLRTWGQAILNYKLLPGFVTRRWMKPTSLTSQWFSVSGAPWEIFRYSIPVDSIANTSKVVDAYTKSGDVGLYSSLFALIPDFNMGISVLTAGDSPNRQVPPVRGVLVDIFYKAAEAAAKEQAKNAFTGTFKAKDRNSTMTLEVNEGPGVAITNWISNSTDFLAQEYYAAYDDFRLYPTALKHTTAGDPLTYYKYHLQTLQNMRKPVVGDPWSEFNEYWFQTDEGMYNNLASDAFVVGFDKHGIVQSVACQALRSTYYRTA